MQSVAFPFLVGLLMAVAEAGAESRADKACPARLVLVQGTEIVPDIAATPDPAGSPYFRQVKGISVLGKVTPAELRFLGAFTEARSLSFENAELADGDMSAFAALTKLRVLWVQRGNTHFTGAGLWEIRNAGRLTYLSLDSTGLVDEHLYLLDMYRDLETLSLRDTAVVGRGLRGVSLPELRSLILEGTLFADEHLQHLNGFRRLQDLSLRRTRITGPGLKTLRLRELRSLDLSESLLQEVPEPEVAGDLPALTTLLLSNTSIDDKSLPRIAQYKALRSLVLDGTRIRGQEMGVLARLPELQDIDLCHTPLRAEHIGRLASCQSLKLLLVTPGPPEFQDALRKLKAIKPDLDIAGLGEQTSPNP